MTKYLNCPFLKNSIHFFYDNIRACCSNVSGPVFYENYKGEKPVDWEYIYNFRKNIINKINNGEFQDGIPDECIGCCDIEKYLSDEKIEEFTNKIRDFYFQNNMSCNAKCTYCSFGQVGQGCRYKLLPIINSLIENKIIDEKIVCFMSGGEMTINPEFHELLSILSQQNNPYINIFSSGIKYSESIKEAFIINPNFHMMISVDAGTKETYKKIKLVDCFDTIVENLREYTQASENAKNNIVLKYILVDDVNDNIDEIKKFFEVVLSLGIKSVRMDVDFVKYRYGENKKVPPHYFELFDEFHKIAEENNLIVQKYDQSEAILEYGKQT